MGEALKVAKLEPDIPLDVTFSPIATGNEKYINWDEALNSFINRCSSMLFGDG